MRASFAGLPGCRVGIDTEAAEADRGRRGEVPNVPKIEWVIPGQRRKHPWMLGFRPHLDDDDRFGDAGG